MDVTAAGMGRDILVVITAKTNPKNAVPWSCENKSRVKERLFLSSIGKQNEDDDKPVAIHKQRHHDY